MKRRGGVVRVPVRRHVRNSTRLRAGVYPTVKEIEAAFRECHANRIGEARDAVRFWCRFGIPIDPRHFSWLEYVVYTDRFVRSCRRGRW